MHERESVARELSDSPYETNQARGDKVLKIARSNMAEIIDFPESPMLDSVTEKMKKNQGLKKLVTSTVVGLAATVGAAAYKGTTAKNSGPVIEFQDTAIADIVKVEPDMDNLITISVTETAPPVEITTPESTSDETDLATESDFEFKPTPEPTPGPVTSNDVYQAHEHIPSSQISDGLDVAIRTAFSEGAYSSEEEARKIADVIINRAMRDGLSVGAEVSKKGQFQSYGDGVNGRGNWGWREYGSGPQSGSIGTERVQQIFMEELDKATSGQPLAYGYTGFGASGDGITNNFH